MLFLSKQVETNKERQKLIDEKKIIKNLRWYNLYYKFINNTNENFLRHTRI